KLPDARVLAGKVIATDKRRDLALVQVDATGLSFARFGTEADPGEEVYAVETPDGLEATVTRGIVSAYRRIDGVVLLQTDASINPGNSGGPIVSARRGTSSGSSARRTGTVPRVSASPWPRARCRSSWTCAPRAPQAGSPSGILSVSDDAGAAEVPHRPC